MTKDQFIATLERQLLRLPKADRDDILSDYESHFAAGAADGKTEAEVCAELGDPSELAEVYLENLPEEAKGAPVYYLPDMKQPEQNEYHAPTYSGGDNVYEGSFKSTGTAADQQEGGDKTAAIVIVILLSVFVAAPIFGTLVGVWFSLLGICIACVAGGFALLAAGAAATASAVLAGIGLILLAIACIALAVLCVLGMAAGAKGIVYVVKWYVDVCKKMIKGGVNL